MSIKEICWNEEKNQLLKLQRGVNFEQVLNEIELGNILARQKHPNSEKYPNQEIFILRIEDYIYYVPFIENEEEIFLKTIIPSRKLNKRYKDTK
jgi:uncharacterized DUF497 family protein